MRREQLVNALIPMQEGAMMLNKDEIHLSNILKKAMC